MRPERGAFLKIRVWSIDSDERSGTLLPALALSVCVENGQRLEASRSQTRIRTGRLRCLLLVFCPQRVYVSV